jgi:hypothetical protein
MRVRRPVPDWRGIRSLCGRSVGTRRDIMTDGGDRDVGAGDRRDQAQTRL